MTGMMEDLSRIPLFRDDTGIHDINLIGNIRHDAEIMGDV
jgi:hypothetical protein